MRELLMNLWTKESAARAFLFSIAEGAKYVFSAEPYVVAAAFVVQAVALGVASKSASTDGSAPVPPLTWPTW